MKRWWLWAGLALVVSLGVSLALLWRDADAAATHLAAARSDLVGARTAMGEGNVDAARTAVADARTDVRAAVTRVDGPLWWLAERVPRYGASAEAVRAGVDLVGAAGDLADAVAGDAAELLDEGAAAFVGDDGRIRTDRLRAVADNLDGLPLAPVEQARDRLADLPAGGLVGPAREGRDDAVALADQALAAIDRARQGMRAFSGFLGADGSRTYLLAVQNPGELRGTGGLISYLSELRIVDGEISVRAAGLEVTDDLGPLTRPGQTGNSTRDLTPVSRPPAFAERYDHNAGGAILQSVNLDPHLPMVGPVLLHLYAARGGSELDGVVMVDPLSLAGIVAATGGPLEVSDAFADVDGLPDALTPQNLAETLLVTIYDAFGGENPQRRAFDEAVTLQVLKRLTSGGWDPVELGQALGDAAAARHLQLHSTVEQEQAAFELLGLGGQMPPADGEGDLLAVTGVNAGPDKSDVHVAHRISGELELGARAIPGTVRRRADIKVALENPLAPGDHDTYITGSHEPVPVGSGAPPREDDALNRTWFTVWTPPLTQLRSLQDGVHGRPIRYSNIHGHRAFDYFLETRSASTNSFSVELEGEVVLRRDGDAWVYDLTLWRQAKAIPDHWDLTITAPSGWAVAEATVDGGGSPTGMGVGGQDGERITALVENGEVRVTGAVTRDATVTVRLTRP